MTNTNVKNAGMVQGTKSISSNYSYVQKTSAKEADTAFGNLMQNSLNKMAAFNQQSKTTQEKMSTRRSQVEYIVRGARHTGDGKAVDESVMAGSLKALTGEVKAVVCAVLDMTDEELEKFLAENGLCVMDLLSQNNLADLVAETLAEGDALKLLTDSSISETFSQLGNELENLISAAAQEMGLSTDELTAMLQSTDTVQPLAQELPAGQTAVEPADGRTEAVSEKNSAETAKVDDSANLDVKLEDKITLESDKKENSQSELSGNGNESISGQFLKTLIGNVDNAVNAESTFKGYTVNAEDVVRQLVDAIKVNVNGSFSEMELQLQPENLGKLNLVISSRDGIITAQLMAENENVKNVIENQIVMLKDNFEQQGLKVDAVEVTVQTHGFEMGKNLEGSEENSQNEEKHRNSRSLTLEEINAIIGDDEAADEDVLAAEMMKAMGGNVDYMV